MNKVLFPYFSNIQDDIEQIKHIMIQRIKILTMISYPMSVFIIILLPNIIHLFYGDKWEGAILPLRLLAIVIMVRSVTGDLAIILKSIGKVKELAKLHFVNFIIIKLIAIALGTYYYDFNGFLYALIISQVIAAVIDYCFIVQHVYIRLKEIIFINFLNGLSGVFIGGILIQLNKFISEVTLFNIIITSITSIILLILYFYCISKLDFIRPYIFQFQTLKKAE